jgi:hypothetical protein
MRIDDDLPAPQSYLRAGLPRPQQGPGVLSALAGNIVGSRADAQRLLEQPEQPTVGSQSVTVADDVGAPQAVVSVRSSQFLSYPVMADRSDGEVLAVLRAPSGMPIVRRGPEQAARSVPWPTPVDTASSRVVTVDLSAILAGLDPARFAAKDAMFVSAALAIELAVLLGEHERSGRVTPSISYRAWNRSIPVPVDHAVLRVFAKLAGVDGLHLHTTTSLDRTDLLCAATAIVYDAPLYTTKPDAYKVLKNGLKLIEYGPVRNKAAAGDSVADGQETPTRQQGPAWEPPPADPMEAAAALCDAYSRGESFEPDGPALLEAALDAPDALADAVTDILLAVHEDADPTWRIALLDRAEQLAPTLRQASEAHARLLSAVGQLNSLRPQGYRDPARERQADAALGAYGHWGHWPEDADDDTLGDLEDGDDHPATLAWYRRYLTMAGIPRDVIDAEMTAVEAHTSRPSRQRIEELRATTG